MGFKKEKSLQKSTQSPRKPLNGVVSKKRKHFDDEPHSEQSSIALTPPPKKKMLTNLDITPIIKKKKIKNKKRKSLNVSFNLHNNSIQEIPPIVKEMGFLVFNDSFILRPDLQKEGDDGDESCVAGDSSASEVSDADSPPAVSKSDKTGKDVSKKVKQGKRKALKKKQSKEPLSNTVAKTASR